jgi:hypothetical protein
MEASKLKLWRENNTPVRTGEAAQNGFGLFALEFVQYFRQEDSLAGLAVLFRARKLSIMIIDSSLALRTRVLHVAAHANPAAVTSGQNWLRCCGCVYPGAFPWQINPLQPVTLLIFQLVEAAGNSGQAKTVNIWYFATVRNSQIGACNYYIR